MTLVYFAAALVAAFVGISVSTAMLSGRMSVPSAAFVFGAAVTVAVLIFGLSQQVGLEGLACMGLLSFVLISGWMLVLGRAFKQRRSR